MNKIHGLIYLSAISLGCFGLNMGSVNALTLTGTSCSVDNVSGASACLGIYQGNNSNQNLNGLFGIDDWGNEFLKVDDSSGNTSSNGISLTVTDNGGAISGTWSLSGIDLSNYNVMAILKGGNSFSAYLLNSLDGTWNNNDMLRGSQRGAGLSHFSIYTSAISTSQNDINNNTAESVPEPLTILGTALALALGGLFKSKQKSKS